MSRLGPLSGRPRALHSLANLYRLARNSGAGALPDGRAEFGLTWRGAVPPFPSGATGVDPPPDRRLPAPPRSHGRRARLLRGRRRAGCRRAAADPRRRRRRRGRIHRRARPVRRRAGRARARPVRPVVRPPLLRRAPLPRRPARPPPPRVRRRHAARRRAAGRAAHRAGGVAGDHGPAAPAGAAVDGAVHARHRLARRHVGRGDAVALAAAHPRHARRAAGRRDRHDPVPPVAVPGHVVGAAAGGGRRAAGGGDRHRRAGGQGLRPGGA